MGLMVNWRNIPIALTDLKKGEQTAHTGEICNQAKQRIATPSAILRSAFSARLGAPVKKEPTWIRIVRPPFLAIGFVASTIYAGLLGW